MIIFKENQFLKNLTHNYRVKENISYPNKIIINVVNKVTELNILCTEYPSDKL